MIKNIFNKSNKLKSNNNKLNKSNKLLIIKTLLRKSLIIKNKLDRAKIPSLIKSSRVN
jgi:hypothetical protein